MNEFSEKFRNSFLILDGLLKGDTEEGKKFHADLLRREKERIDIIRKEIEERGVNNEN